MIIHVAHCGTAWTICVLSARRHGFSVARDYWKINYSPFDHVRWKECYSSHLSSGWHGFSSGFPSGYGLGKPMPSIVQMRWVLHSIKQQTNKRKNKLSDFFLDYFIMGSLCWQWHRHFPLSGEWSSVGGWALLKQELGLIKNLNVLPSNLIMPVVLL